MTLHRSALLVLLALFVSCINHQPAQNPKKAALMSSLERPHRTLVALLYTINKMEKAVADNALLVKRRCFQKHYRSRRDWLKCIKETASVDSVWKMAIGPLVRNKIYEIYLKIDKKDGAWKKELKELVCGLRVALPEFRAYTNGKYDEATEQLSKLLVTCPKPKLPKPAPSRSATPLRK